MSWNSFLYSSRSMENILQSLVKIIIIGALYEKTNVDCNRQFLPPPLPYYQNEDHHIPGFAPSFHDQLPTYYPERNLPDPTSFQNFKSYTPAQLFYQNENYIPPPMANPGLTYPPTHLFPYKQPFHPHKPSQKPNFALSRVQYRNPPRPQPARPQQLSQKKTEAFASNIIVKEEPLSPYYADDYGKNYNDEDYTDSYSDDTPAPPKPCTANDPYRYFEAPKGIPSNQKNPLCNPYFQPNFGSSVYTLKVPITLLPSRFPPRVEQLIERIQNYFSTYTHHQTPKPHNETAPASTTPPALETSTATAVEEVHGNNKTEESQQETTAQTEAAEERTTERTTATATEAKDSKTFSTTAPDAEIRNESQTEAQTSRGVDEATEGVRGATETLAESSSPTNRPVDEATPAGDASPQNLLPEELQSAASSSSPAADPKKGNENTGVPHATASFQAADSNNG